MSSLFDELSSAAGTRSGRPALTFLDAGGAATTYRFGELFEAAAGIGARMVARGLAERSRPLGILLRSQEQQVLHYLAALGIGAVPAILTPPNPKLNRAYYEQTMRKVLRHGGFSAVVTDQLTDGVPARTFEPTTLVPRPGAAGSRGAAQEPASPTGELDASFLQFSSGTTGIKRGVLVTDDAVLAQLRGYAEALELDERDCIVSWLPLYHDMGFIACLNLPLLLRVHTVMIDPIDWVTRPSSLLHAVTRFGGTLSWNPNFAYAFMAERIRDRDLAGADLSSLRGLVNCSEPVTFASQQKFLERFGPLGLPEDVFLGCYAMAETTFALTHGAASAEQALDDLGPRNGVRARGSDPYVSVGRPIAGVELRITDERGNECAEREIGEIRVRSPFDFHGYHGDEQATREAFDGGWYLTGDLGYRLGDELFVTGRRKDVLIVSGVNVFPGDLEAVAGEVTGVVPGRVAAFSSFDEQLQTEHITVLAESDLSGDQARRETVIAIRQRLLAGFQIGNFDVQLVPPGWLVKSSSGKMARRANREKWSAERGSGASEASRLQVQREARSRS